MFSNDRFLKDLVVLDKKMSAFSIMC